MKIKTLPVIITTWEALEKALEDAGWRAVYIDGALYEENADRIFQMMLEHGYTAAEKRGKYGVIYLKTEGVYAFDPSVHEIHDPLGIL